MATMSDIETTKILKHYIKSILLATILVIILGYLDFVTGEISIDILYMLCIGLVTWHTNTFAGLFCVFEVLVAKTSADYLCQIKVGTHLYGWNAFNDVIIYIFVCLLVGKLRKVLSNDNAEWKAR